MEGEVLEGARVVVVAAFPEARAGLGALGAVRDVRRAPLFGALGFGFAATGAEPRVVARLTLPVSTRAEGTVVAARGSVRPLPHGRPRRQSMDSASEATSANSERKEAAVPGSWISTAFSKESSALPEKLNDPVQTALGRSRVWPPGEV
ncbi:hypothetical protein ASF47_18945 [Nocardioides sp. Leaf285]|nr:hypothetical protein ASF47_18945 [Nocardioides sp. Leaf285]